MFTLKVVILIILLICGSVLGYLFNMIQTDKCKEISSTLFALICIYDTKDHFITDIAIGAGIGLLVWIIWIIILNTRKAFHA